MGDHVKATEGTEIILMSWGQSFLPLNGPSSHPVISRSMVTDSRGLKGESQEGHGQGILLLEVRYQEGVIHEDQGLCCLDERKNTLSKGTAEISQMLYWKLLQGSLVTCDFT